MSDQWSFTENDLAFLDDVAEMEMGMVARKWAEIKGWAIEKAEANARAWLHRIRIRVKRCQDYVNKIYAKQRRSSRIRKLTTSGALPESLDDAEDF